MCVYTCTFVINLNFKLLLMYLFIYLLFIDMLLVAPVSGTANNTLPPPNQLKRKIIVKVRYTATACTCTCVL